jgi:hypothetical protein
MTSVSTASNPIHESGSERYGNLGARRDIQSRRADIGIGQRTE